MQELNDSAYYEARAAKARAAAASATDPSIAMIHRGLADNYEELAERAAAIADERE